MAARQVRAGKAVRAVRRRAVRVVVVPRLRSRLCPFLQQESRPLRLRAELETAAPATTRRRVRQRRRTVAVVVADVAVAAA